MSDAKDLILALDQGTTSSRAIIFDRQVRVRAVGQNDFAQYYPHPGWVEHDALEILSSQLSAITEALVVGSVEPAHIKAIGITNQRETTVIWNRVTGIPIAPAIVWQCRRTSEMIDELTSDPAVYERIRKTTGLVPDAYFSASKIKWLLDNTPGARAAAQRGELAFGTIDSWLVWQLTGGATHATDYTNASRTMLFNIHEGCWDEWLLDLFSVPTSLLPEVRPSAAYYGYTAHPSIPGGIPICGVAGDQQAALFGQCCFKPGEAKNTYGTGCFMLVHTGNKAPLSEHQLITTIAASAPAADPGTSSLTPGSPSGTPSSSSTISNSPSLAPNEGEDLPLTPLTNTTANPPHTTKPPLEYALEGSVFVSGALIQWLRDELGLITTAAESGQLAKQVENTQGVYIVPAFTGLGAPYWDMDARGAIIGLTRGVTKAHIVRAALEAIAYQLADLVEAVRADTSLPIECLKVDGGGAVNDFMLQFQSDVLNTQIARPGNTESTALGAAFLAGLACGLWQDVSELCALASQKEDIVFSPQIDEAERQELLSGWHDAVARVRSR